MDNVHIKCGGIIISISEKTLIQPIINNNRERGEQVTLYKCLDIHFDSELQWAHQVEFLHE